MNARIAIAIACCSLLLAACGGGGSYNAPATTTTTTTDTGGVPASAQASVSGFVAYLQQLIAAGADETGEPVSLDKVSLPTDDEAPPIPI